MSKSKGKEICSLVRSRLRNLPIYNESDKVYVRVLSNTTDIRYRTSKDRKESAEFHISISNRTGYVHKFIVDQEQSKNYQTALYQIIEKILKEQCCEKVRVPLPSDINFWCSLGFKETALASILEKPLQL